MSTGVNLDYLLPRYSNSAEEPDPTNRLIQFTVFDGIFSDSASLTLQLQVVDDNPTMVRAIAG